MCAHKVQLTLYVCPCRPARPPAPKYMATAAPCLNGAALLRCPLPIPEAASARTPSSIGPPMRPQLLHSGIGQPPLPPSSTPPDGNTMPEGIHPTKWPSRLHDRPGAATAATATGDGYKERCTADVTMGRKAFKEPGGGGGAGDEVYIQELIARQPHWRPSHVRS